MDLEDNDRLTIIISIILVSTFITSSIIIDNMDKKNDVFTVTWDLYEIEPFREQNGLIFFNLEILYKDAVLTYNISDNSSDINNGLLINNSTIFFQEQAYRVESISSEKLVISAVPSCVFVNDIFQVKFVIRSSEEKIISYELRQDDRFYKVRNASIIKGSNIIQESLEFSTSGIHKISLIVNYEDLIYEIYVWVNVI